MFRLLLRESSGTSQAFRTATAREIKHFVDELSEYIAQRNSHSQYVAQVQAEGMVTIVFTAGANALDMEKQSENSSNKESFYNCVCYLKGQNIHITKRAISC